MLPVSGKEWALRNNKRTEPVQKAVVNEETISAGPDSPDVATCPSCGGVVEKRKRQMMSGQATYFYRHKAGEGQDCPLRYRPGS
jgi:hypothetical protein